MTGRSRTQIDHYGLVSLTIDGELIPFTTATITKETVLVEVVTPWERGATTWHGQIVWDVLAPGVIDTHMPRKFSGLTAKGETLQGHFVITQ